MNGRNAGKSAGFCTRAAMIAIVADNELRAEYIIPSAFDNRVTDRVAKAVAEAAIQTHALR